MLINTNHKLLTLINKNKQKELLNVINEDVQNVKQWTKYASN